MLGKGLQTLLASAILTAPVAAQTADELIAHSIEARGGLAKLKAVNSLRLSGKMTTGSREAALVVELKRPSSVRLEANFEGSPAVQAYDGKNAWGIPPGSSKPEPMPAEMTQEMAQKADQIDGPLVDYQAKGSQVVLVGREKISSGEAYRLKLTRKTGEVEFHFLDARTYLPVRVESRRSIQGLAIQAESSLGDFTAVEGLLWARTIKNIVKGMPGSQTTTFTSIEVNPPIDDSRFRAPVASAGGTAKQD